MNYLNILFFVLVCSQAFGLQIDNEGESHRKLVEEIDIYFDQAEISLHDNPEGTLESARESANKILDVQDGALRGHFYYRFAGLYLDLFQLDSAMYFYSISKENLESVSQNTEALGTLAKVWHNLGLIYQLNGDYDVYLDYIINHAIPIQEKIGDKRTMAKNLVGIAIVLHNLKDYEKAVTYFNMALEIAKELDDFEDTADIYLRIFHAEVGWNQDQNKKMLSSLLDKVGSLLEGMSPNYRHILLYEAKGLFEEISDDDNAAALKYYNEGIDLAVDLNEKRLELELLNRTFYLLMELKRYSDVEQVFDQIEAHSKYLSRGDKILILNNKADFLAAIGKPAEALEVLKSTISLKDSISKNRADLKAFELEMQYNSKVKENLILQLENENQKALLKLGKRRLMIFYLIFFSVLLLGFTLFVISSNKTRRKHLQIEKEELNRKMELMASRIEIERLQASLDGQLKERERLAKELHDGIGSVLTGIKFKVASMRMDHRESGVLNTFYQIEMSIKNTIESLKEVIKDLIPEKILKTGLANAIRVFSQDLSPVIQLEIKDENKLSLILQPELQFQIFRICQELLCNAVKYANSDSINLFMSEEKHELIIEVKDDGDGFEVEEEGGNGLQNVKKRINDLQGTWVLESSRGEGTYWRILIPV